MTVRPTFERTSPERLQACRQFYARLAMLYEREGRGVSYNAFTFGMVKFCKEYLKRISASDHLVSFKNPQPHHRTDRRPRPNPWPSGLTPRRRHRLPPGTDWPRKHLPRWRNPRHDPREIKRKFAEIVAFAEIDKFLDTPVIGLLYEGNTHRLQTT